MDERDRAVADDWMRDHLPDPEQLEWQDNEEEGDTRSYFFLRYGDSATVVYKVAVKTGKRTCELQWYLNRILLSVRSELR